MFPSSDGSDEEPADVRQENMVEVEAVDGPVVVKVNQTVEERPYLEILSSEPEKKQNVGLNSLGSNYKEKYVTIDAEKDILGHQDPIADVEPTDLSPPNDSPDRGDLVKEGERLPSFLSPAKNAFQIGSQPSLCAPRFTKELMDITVLEGDAAMLQCYAKGEPSPDLVWFKDGKDIDEDDDGYEINTMIYEDCYTELVIHEVTCEDEGEYRVVARNTHGEAFCKAYLNVEVLDEEGESETGTSGRSDSSDKESDPKSTSDNDSKSHQQDSKVTKTEGHTPQGSNNNNAIDAVDSSSVMSNSDSNIEADETQVNLESPSETTQIDLKSSIANSEYLQWHSSFVVVDGEHQKVFAQYEEAPSVLDFESKPSTIAQADVDPPTEPLEKILYGSYTPEDHNKNFKEQQNQENNNQTELLPDVLEQVALGQCNRPPKQMVVGDLFAAITVEPDLCIAGANEDTFLTENVETKHVLDPSDMLTASGLLHATKGLM